MKNCKLSWRHWLWETYILQLLYFHLLLGSRFVGDDRQEDLLKKYYFPDNLDQKFNKQGGRGRLLGT